MAVSGDPSPSPVDEFDYDSPEMMAALGPTVPRPPARQPALEALPAAPAFLEPEPRDEEDLGAAAPAASDLPPTVVDCARAI
eukprot:11453277-Alexandrium_andersonii.AAC.1